MSPQPERYYRSDSREVADLWYRSWLSSGPHRPDEVTPAIFEQRLEDEPWEIWVVRETSSIVAFLALDKERCILAQLFIAPSHQEMGTGKRLLDLAKSELAGGFRLRTDESNSGARRFYERHGLSLDRVEDGRAYYAWQPARGSAR